MYKNPHNQQYKLDRQESNVTQDNLEFNLDQQFTEKKINKRIRLMPQSKLKGFTFGHGRYDTEKKNDTPGPGHYYAKSQVTPVSYSMGARTIIYKKDEVPPLGIYEIKGLDRYGYYSNSKFKNACATLINPPKSNNQAKSMPSPGPGDYEVPGSMNNSGMYFISNYKTKIGWALGKKSLLIRQPYY